MSFERVRIADGDYVKWGNLVKEWSKGTKSRPETLAEFYGVPISELLPDAPESGPATEPPDRLVLDLERLHQLDFSEAEPLARFTASIQAQRGDYNGRVLSIRQDDLRTLAVIYDEAPSQLSERLIDWGVLRASTVGADGDEVDPVEHL